MSAPTELSDIELALLVQARIARAFGAGEGKGVESRLHDEAFQSLSELVRRFLKIGAANAAP